MGEHRGCDLIRNAFNSFIGSDPSYRNRRNGVGDPLCIPIYCGRDIFINHVLIPSSGPLPIGGFTKVT